MDVHTGMCSSDSFQIFKSKLIEDPNFKKDFNVLEHMKALKFQIKRKNINELADFMKKTKAHSEREKLEFRLILQNRWSPQPLYVASSKRSK